MVIVETPVFTRLVKALMSDEDYRALQEVLVTRPDAGDLIPGSGGLRKVRWNQEGKGKRGGIRAIYFWAVGDDQIFLLYVYSKVRQENLTSDQLKQLKAIVERW